MTDHSVASQIDRLLADPRLAVVAYDGSSAGARDAAATIVVKGPEAIQQIIWAPGELGLARAFVSGSLDIEGDLYAALSTATDIGRRMANPFAIASIVRLVRQAGLSRPPVPPEEAKLTGRRHSKDRDAAAISHHYDVSNKFYEMVLGPSMTYSCAVYGTDATALTDAQAAKYELVCAKLDLRPGMRLLDVGCGWGSMVRHAAKYHGVHAVGITLSKNQAEYAQAQVIADGLEDQVEIRVQDYRDIPDGPYDAISSIGMFEHVGYDQISEYFQQLFDLVRPGGRVLNHAISRPGEGSIIKSKFMVRYVFPDGELLEVGRVVSALQSVGLEARHVESLREHYALTLRDWVTNLEENWDAAVAEVGEGRARVWRLYMAACAIAFEVNRVQIHQVLADRPAGGDSGMPLRPTW